MSLRAQRSNLDGVDRYQVSDPYHYEDRKRQRAEEADIGVVILDDRVTTWCLTRNEAREMKHVTSIGYRRPRESGGPGQPLEPCDPSVPAFAGMTDKRLILQESLWFRLLGCQAAGEGPP
jgi:hypothetical protein